MMEFIEFQVSTSAASHSNTVGQYSAKDFSLSNVSMAVDNMFAITESAFRDGSFSDSIEVAVEGLYLVIHDVLLKEDLR